MRTDSWSSAEFQSIPNSSIDSLISTVDGRQIDSDGPIKFTDWSRMTNYWILITMGRTKKVGSTGRFGARYGAKLRRRVLDLDLRRREPNRCPACATKALKRKAAGLWTCRKCGLVFAGGAYVPFTDAGKAAKRAIAQRVSDDLLALRDEEGEEGLPEFLPNIEGEPVIESEPEVIEAEDLIHSFDESSEDEEE